MLHAQIGMRMTTYLSMYTNNLRCAERDSSTTTKDVAFNPSFYKETHFLWYLASKELCSQLAIVKEERVEGEPEEEKCKHGTPQYS